MALTGIFEVAMAARDVLGKERYTEDDCRKVATELASVGLKTYAALRLGFPPDPMRRSEMVRGLCKEVKLEDAFELVEAMALGALSIPVEACSAPLVASPHLFAPKRLLG